MERHEEKLQSMLRNRHFKLVNNGKYKLEITIILWVRFFFQGENKCFPKSARSCNQQMRNEYQ